MINDNESNLRGHCEGRGNRAGAVDTVGGCDIVPVRDCGVLD